MEWAANGLMLRFKVTGYEIRERRKWYTIEYISLYSSFSSFVLYLTTIIVAIDISIKAKLNRELRYDEFN